MHKRPVSWALKAVGHVPTSDLRNSRSVFEVTSRLNGKKPHCAGLMHLVGYPKGPGALVEENGNAVPRYRSQRAERCNVPYGHRVRLALVGFVVRPHRSTPLNGRAPQRWGALSL